MAVKSGRRTADSAVEPTRRDDYPGWYQSVVREAELAEMSHVRGCMVIKPWGYAIWERLQASLDRMIKARGVRNAYFPLFIPLDYIQKEAAHVEGFAREMAVVTHHRLEERDGKLTPAGKLDTPLVVRPTSETIIGESFAQWIRSYRDLPLRINQWSNAVRWELRPRVFLRTTEFLWQEGHTAHATYEEAMEETRAMLEVYRRLAEQWLAMPVIAGEKPPSERFPGALQTFSIEAMMQDRKALQAGTSHFLGQNFSRSAGIAFLGADGEEKHAFTTSWGVSTRLIGGLIMTHGDDDGVRLPPRTSPHQVVIVPVLRDREDDREILAYARETGELLRRGSFGDGSSIDVHVDETPYRSVEKKWSWIKRGVPLLLELGPRDRRDRAVTFLDRGEPERSYRSVDRQGFVERAGSLLDEIQQRYLDEARAFLRANTRRDLVDVTELRDHFGDRAGTSHHPGFVIARWCGGESCAGALKPLGVTIRCLPFDQPGGEGPCILCGGSAQTEAVFARAY